MEAPITLEGFEGHTIELHTPGILQGPRITFDGKPAPKGKGRNRYTLTRNDGQAKTVRLKPSLLYDFPSIEVDGKKYAAVPPLRWYEYGVSLLPLILIFGGLIGIVLALVIFLINIRVFRSDIPIAARYLLVLTLSVGLPVLYYLATFVLVLLSQAQ